MDSEGEEEQRLEEVLKRHLEVFKQMTTLATASMLVVLALRGQGAEIPLAAFITALFGFGASLWFALYGMYYAASTDPAQGMSLRWLRRVLQLSWLSFAGGLYFSILVGVLIYTEWHLAWWVYGGIILTALAAWFLAKRWE